MTSIVLRNDLRGGSLRFPLPGGEGQGEGLRPYSHAIQCPSPKASPPHPHPLPMGRGSRRANATSSHLNTPQPAASSRHGQHGFTLIELLVSLTVMAVILMLIGGALRVMGRNWDANAGRIEALDMVSRAFDLLARDAANLQRITLPSGLPAYLFSGKADSLAFVALEPPQPGEAGLYFIAYTLEPNGAQRRADPLARALAPGHGALPRRDAGQSRAAAHRAVCLSLRLWQHRRRQAELVRRLDVRQPPARSHPPGSAGPQRRARARPADDRPHCAPTPSSTASRRNRRCAAPRPAGNCRWRKAAPRSRRSGASDDRPFRGKAGIGSAAWRCSWCCGV